MEIFIPKISSEHEANIVSEILSKAIADIERQRGLIRANSSNSEDYYAWRKSIIGARDYALKLGADASACRKAAMRFNVGFVQVQHFVNAKQLALRREAVANRKRAVLSMKARGKTVQDIMRATDLGRSRVYEIIREAND